MVSAHTLSMHADALADGLPREYSVSAHRWRLRCADNAAAVSPGPGVPVQAWQEEPLDPGADVGRRETGVQPAKVRIRL